MRRAVANNLGVLNIEQEDDRPRLTYRMVQKNHLECLKTNIWKHITTATTSQKTISGCVMVHPNIAAENIIPTTMAINARKSSHPFQ
jgi:hypothetical protein